MNFNVGDRVKYIGNIGYEEHDKIANEPSIALWSLGEVTYLYDFKQKGGRDIEVYFDEIGARYRCGKSELEVL